MATKHIGSSFRDFLEEEEIKNDVDLLTVKKVIADELRARMERMSIGVAQFARRMKTGRDVAYRLLDKEDTGVTLKTLSKAARALDWSLLEMLATVEQEHKPKKVAAKAKPRERARPAS